MYHKTIPEWIYAWVRYNNDYYLLSNTPCSRFMNFQTNNQHFNTLNYSSKYVQCYELQEVMWQNNIHFINILNRFRIASQTIKDIKFMNNNCLKTPLMDNTLPYLLYTNIKTTMHNKNVFLNKLNQTFTFLTCDVHVETCHSHFKWSNLPF
jgi:hypothetical protein